MTTHTGKPLLYGALPALICLAVLPARAQLATPTLTYTLLNPNVTAAPGTSVTFEAELTNTAGVPLYLNLDAGLVDLPLSVDDTAFYSTFVLPTPQPVLPDDGLPHTFALFAVDLPADPRLYAGLPTTFNGTFTLYGGLTDGDLDLLGSQPFSVTLGPSTGGTVPEPGSLALLCGLASTGASLMYHRKQKRR